MTQAARLALGVMFAAAPGLAWAQSSLAAPQEQAIDLPVGGSTWSGTLLVPVVTGKMPVALIIAGSGPTDRDGNSIILLPGKNDVYKLLAEALAAQGIASLRYDKLAVGKSTPPPGMKEDDLRFEIYVDGAAAWIDRLKKDGRFSTVTIIGHSEGSLVGILAARKVKPSALVSIAGVARAANEILRDQLQAQLDPASELMKTSDQILAGLVAGKTSSTVPGPLLALFRPSAQPYLISWFKFVPSKEFSELSMPTLIVQGTHDIQVSIEEAKLLKKAKPNATLVMVDGMNHVMKAAPAERAQQGPSYTNPTLPIVPEAAKAIVAFIQGLR